MNRLGIFYVALADTIESSHPRGLMQLLPRVDGITATSSCF
jgi:hypothetical protein